MALELGPLL